MCYSVAEAALLLGVSEKTVRNAVKRGDFPRVPYVGVRILIPGEGAAGDHQRRDH